MVHGVNIDIYNKYLKLVRDEKWTMEDFGKTLRRRRGHLSSKISKPLRETLINVLSSNSVINEIEESDLNIDSISDHVKNEKLVNYIKNKDIIPCLPLLLTTFEENTMTYLCKYLVDDLRGNSETPTKEEKTTDKMPQDEGTQSNSDLLQSRVDKKHLNDISECVADNVAMDEWNLIMEKLLAKQPSKLEGIKSNRSYDELPNRVLEALKRWYNMTATADNTFSKFLSYFEKNVPLKETLEEKWKTEWSKMQ